MEKWSYKGIESCKGRTCATYSYARIQTDSPWWGCNSNCGDYLRRGLIESEHETSRCRHGNELCFREANSGVEKTVKVFPKIYEKDFNP